MVQTKSLFVINSRNCKILPPHGLYHTKSLANTKSITPNSVSDTLVSLTHTYYPIFSPLPVPIAHPIHLLPLATFFMPHTHHPSQQLPYTSLPHPRLIWESFPCYWDPNIPPKSRFLRPNLTKLAELIALIAARSWCKLKKKNKFQSSGRRAEFRYLQLTWRVILLLDHSFIVIFGFKTK